jgi:hypothetical protein
MKLKIINILASFFIAVVFLFGCIDANQDLLCKKWKTIALQNSKMEQEIKFMEQYVDTIGQNDPELRMAINLDSAKMQMKEEMQRSLFEQKQAIENTLMEFKSNGIAYTTSIDGIDSAMYTIENNFIKIDEAKLKGVGETMTFEILSLSKDTLKMQLVDYGDTSVVVMIPTN